MFDKVRQTAWCNLRHLQKSHVHFPPRIWHIEHKSTMLTIHENLYLHRRCVQPTILSAELQPEICIKTVLFWLWDVLHLNLASTSQRRNILLHKRHKHHIASKSVQCGPILPRARCAGCRSERETAARFCPDVSVSMSNRAESFNSPCLEVHPLTLFLLSVPVNTDLRTDRPAFVRWRCLNHAWTPVSKDFSLGLSCLSLFARAVTL